MAFATPARSIGVLLLPLLLLEACGGQSESAEGEPGDGDSGVPPSDVARWVKPLDGSYARLLGRPDGSVVVVTTTESETRLQAFAPDGEEAWSHRFEVAPVNAPWDAPEIAVGADDETYLSLNVPSEQVGAIGLATAECSNGCSVVASFDAEGEQRWLTARPPSQSRFLAALEDGVVVATIDFSSAPGLTRLTSAGEIAWQQPWLFTDFASAIMEGGAFAAGDGSGGFYLASSTRGTDSRTCGVITRYDGEAGTESWSREHCGESPSSTVSFSNVVALGDGAVAVLASEMEARTVLSVRETGDPRTIAALPQASRLLPFDGASVLAVATQAGPLAAIDDDGGALWQWPGQLDAGALTVHPSGLCEGSAALAPDGELYVLTRACAAARALLGAPLAEGEALDADIWLLARLRLDANDAGAARCGNGWLDPGERCDGEDFAVPGEPRDGIPRPVQCGSWLSGEGWTASPTCMATCEVDLAACETTCGNGQLDEGEGCDGDIFRNAQSCDEAQLGSGPLGCDNCEVDLSVCPMRASCGNGQLEEWEVCDEELAREPLACEDLGLPSPGVVGCTPDCRERDYTTCED